MHIALTLQDHFISEVERSLVGSAERTSPGHIETPAEPFWEQCRAALLSAAGALPLNTELLAWSLNMDCFAVRRHGLPSATP
jgi:hypothetical protein